MGARLGTAANFIVVTAAMLVAAAAVHREFFRGASEVPSRQPTYLKAWEEFLRDGILVGDSAAPVKVIEFVDLECPFCRNFHSEFREAKAKHGNSLALVFVHYPIEAHKFAMPAARAAECASAKGRFADFIDVIFHKQDSLGIKSWGSFALEAGVKDTTSFIACTSEKLPLPRVEWTCPDFVDGWLFEAGRSA